MSDLSPAMNDRRWCDFDRLAEVVAGQFSEEAGGVHGVSHWRRVEQHGLWLATRTEVDILAVRLFAWFHDSKRENDYIDPDHGRRGAEYALSLRGRLFDLDDAAMEKLVYACTWHTDRDFTDDLTIGACWDADRLDLGRVGVIPSPGFMNTSRISSRADRRRTAALPEPLILGLKTLPTAAGATRRRRGRN